MRIAEIQGLRALAVLLVIAFHAKFLPGGFIGVDIFYVISGYLITGLLIRELRETGSISLTNFYSRRIKRLLPSTFLVLLSTSVLALIVMPANERETLGRNIVATSLYVSNYLFAWWQNDYQNLGATPSPFIHFWSLAVEEQFYLFWPLLIYLAGSTLKLRRVFRVLALVTLLSFLLSLVATANWPIWSFYTLPTRAWELGLGALVVFFKESEVRYRWLAWPVLLILFLISFLYNEGTPFPGKAALLPTLATAFLIYRISSLPKYLSAIFSSRVSQYIGDISYPLYLWHWPALILPIYILNAPLNVSQRLFCILATFILAGLTHRFIENPFRHMRAPFRKVALVALLATFTSVVIGLGIASSSEQNLKVSGITSSASLKEITRLPEIYADGCQVGKNATASPSCLYGDLHGSRTLVLFGDSHAAQWFPVLNAIALKKSLKLLVLTKSSCPAANVQLPDIGAFRNGPCRAWRENSFARIAKLHPWAVLLSNFDHYRPSGNITDPLGWWKTGVTSTLKRLDNLTQHTILIQDTPWPNRDIPSCLTKRTVNDCVTSRPVASPWMAATSSERVTILDPVNWFCQRKCPAILDGMVVYRDSTHMSVDFSLRLEPLLSIFLANAGIINSS